MGNPKHERGGYFVMELRDGLQARKTIRGFLLREVPKEIITEILTDSIWAPSASNLQPWKYYVMTGEPLSSLRSKILDTHKERKTSYNLSKPSTMPPEYFDRRKKLFKELIPFIRRLGDENRAIIETGSLRFYDAPVVIFISLNTNLHKNCLIDIGLSAENLMLSAHEHGLGTCAVAFTLIYADVLKAALAVPEEDDIVLCIALGFPDDSFPLNEFRSSREDMKTLVSWIGFGD